ncbi:MAG: FIVAR domain-containing protein [Berryella intestinalis]|uniref:FIVAR domain-containing protein n=1 Tax=Berryella intestinalis TaxID=1531429 RepID=UPI002A54313A|nr:FIVAR domain-containing protein [Berryella intestinalis]MDD7369909.1 FIVAR domain-containing protein [Berryella intestinalis]MDY3129438.1 FIVAR domain-containing protein [Berryella intestinalis]
MFLDVYAEGDVDSGRSIKREAVVETDASGVSIVTVTFNNQHYPFLPGKDKAASLRFDWSTIRDHADFRGLNAAIKAATDKGYKASNYTSSTFEAFSNALRETQRIAGDPQASQEAIDGALSALNDAAGGLRAIQNQGHAQTVNLGLSAFNAPYDGSGVQGIGWAGSRVRFGVDGTS